MKYLLALMIFIHPLLWSIDSRMDNSSVYNTGLGGPHSAMAKGFDTFYNNPALLAEYDKEISVFRIITNLKGDALNILNLYLGDSLTLDDPSTLLTTLESEGLDSPYIGVDLVGPLSAGYIGNNWGIFFNNSSSFYLDLPRLLGKAYSIAREDLSLSAGLAYPIDMYESSKVKLVFTPGLMFRAILRGEIEVEKDLIGLLAYMDDTDLFMDENPMYLSPIFALDGGFTFKVNSFFMLSGVVKDIYTPILRYPVAGVEDALEIFTTVQEAQGNLTYREINFGLGFNIPVAPLRGVISDMDIYLDYYDLLMFEKNPFLHLGVGTDITLLDKLHLLGGFYEGLISMGLNIDLKGFNVGFSMYGSEEGSQPGLNSVFNFMVSLGVSF